MVKLVNMYPESSDIVSKLSSVDVVKKMLDLMDESVLVGYPKNNNNVFNNTTKTHCLEAARFYEKTLAGLQIENSTCEALILGALLHDVGKLTVPVDVLYSATPINKKAVELIKSHSQKGVLILHELATVDNHSKKPRFEKWQWDIAIALTLMHHNYKAIAKHCYPNKLMIDDLYSKKIISKRAMDIIDMEKYGELFAICDVYSAVSSGRTYSKRRLHCEELNYPHEIEDRNEKSRSINDIVCFELGLSNEGKDGLERLSEWYCLNG